jgi:hypothetical protein
VEGLKVFALNILIVIKFDPTKKAENLIEFSLISGHALL